MPDTLATKEAAARLVRMKELIDELEQVCSESEQQRRTFMRLREEMEAARRALKVQQS